MPGFLFFVGLIRGLINPHIIYYQGVGENRVVDAFLSAPATADGDIQQKMEALVERPLGEAFPGVGEGGIDVSIHEKADLSRIPFYSISVKGRGQVSEKETFCFL